MTNFTKYASILFVLVFTGAIRPMLAQEAKPGYIPIKIKVRFSAIQPLPDGTTYHVQLPEKLAYTVKKDYGPYLKWFGLMLDIKPNAKDPDYLFKITTDGISEVKSRLVKENSADSPSGYAYTREYAYRISGKLTAVDNRTGQVMYEKVLTDNEEGKAIFHKTYIGPPLGIMEQARPVQPFSDIDELGKFGEQDGRIMKQMESEAMAELFEKVKQVLVTLHGSRLYKDSFMFVTVKSTDTKFVEINAALADLAKTIEIFNSSCVV